MSEKITNYKDLSINDALKTALYIGAIGAGLYACYKFGFTWGVSKTYMAMVDWRPEDAKEFYNFILSQAKK